MRESTLLFAAFLGVVFGSEGIWASEIHVSKAGSDSASGSNAQPFLTISKAASVAQPGDTVIVHTGTYREWVKPIHGGADDSRRIAYRAAPGEEVLVKGSERITSWKPEADGIWKVELPNSFFGQYNPYALTVSGGWLNYGQWHHRGDAYLNGEAFYEKKTAQEVRGAECTWSCQVGGDVTTIQADFGKVNPNTELTEINVRESIFMPEITGLEYITVDGFHFMHAAANWAPPGLALQMGAVGTRMGKCWIVENCTITNARCVGIILGHAPGVDYRDIDAFGDHIIRNNVIRRCGQAGIAGQKGATRSLIIGNLIEDTNYRREFGGWETAAIKFHNSVDTVISGKSGPASRGTPQSRGGPSPARSSQMIAIATSSDPAAKPSPMINIGGPQASEERPAAVISERVQATRTGRFHRRQRKHVSTLSRLRSPHASCTAVSNRCPSVRERGIWRKPPKSACQASTSNSSVALARRMRRRTMRGFTWCPLAA